MFESQTKQKLALSMDLHVLASQLLQAYPCEGMQTCFPCVLDYYDYDATASICSLVAAGEQLFTRVQVLHSVQIWQEW